MKSNEDIPLRNLIDFPSNHSLKQQTYLEDCANFVSNAYIHRRGLRTQKYPPSNMIGVKDWNSYMRALNGKIKNIVTLAHWNGGSSFLAKCERGKEKLREIENYLLLHKIDVLGVSEANLYDNVPLHEYNI